MLKPILDRLAAHQGICRVTLMGMDIDARSYRFSTMDGDKADGRLYLKFFEDMRGMATEPGVTLTLWLDHPDKDLCERGDLVCEGGAPTTVVQADSSPEGWQVISIPDTVARFNAAGLMGNYEFEGSTVLDPDGWSEE